MDSNRRTRCQGLMERDRWAKAQAVVGEMETVRRQGLATWVPVEDAVVDAAEDEAAGGVAEVVGAVTGMRPSAFSAC